MPPTAFVESERTGGAKIFPVFSSAAEIEPSDTLEGDAA